MTSSADQLVPAASDWGEILAQRRFVLPYFVPDEGGTTTLRQLIGGSGARCSDIIRFSVANNDPRKIIRKHSKSDSQQPQESPVSVSDDSGPETEDSAPSKRVGRSEPELPAELQLFAINERCCPVPVIVDDQDQDDKKEMKDKISTKLTLFDESWLQAAHLDDPSRIRAKQSESETARKLTRMKQYDPEDEKEEREKGISTRLQLYEDPWTIRQKLKRNEVLDRNPMLMLLASAGKYIAGLLPKEDLKKLANDRPVKVCLWDVDTGTPHDVELVRRQVRVDSMMFCFIGFGAGWSPEFVRRRGLKEGDEVGLYWDHHHSRLNFRLIARVAAGGD